jgi:tetratricopeptide (TPR) repeat protein
MEMKDYGRARQYLKETMEITAQMGNQVRTAIALHNLAEVALLQGDTSQALEWYSQSLAESRQLGYQQGVMMNFWGCGAILYLQAAYSEAMQKLRQSLRLALELGAQDWAVRCLAWLGLALARQDQNAQAACLLGTVESLNPSKVELAPGDIYREAYESVLAALRASLDETELQRAWAQGAAMS